MGRMHVEKTVACELCAYKCSFPSELKQHKRVKHEGVRYQCDVCEHASTTVTDLARHKEAVHGGVVLPCEFCDFKTCSRQTLQKHHNMKHNPDYVHKPRVRKRAPAAAAGQKQRAKKAREKSPPKS